MLCIASYFVYAANKQYNFLPNLTFIGIISRLPFYYIGYLINRTKGTAPSVSSTADYRGTVPFVLVCVSMLTLSILFFHWHMQTFYSGDQMLHIALFYPVNLCFLFGVLYGCKLLDGIKSGIITNLSIGTLVIIGLHAPVVSLINFILEHILHIQGTICYHWYEALPVSLLITTILYPIVLWGKKHVPILLGRKRT